MDVTFHGLRCVRLRGREAQVVIDPDEASLGNLAKPPPDIVVRTAGATDPGLLRPRPGRPQEVSGPGEYELRGVRIRGLPSGDTNTLMQVELDEVNVVALGRLDRPLTEEEVESLGQVDVLVIAMAAGEGLGASAASKLVNAISPAVVLPVGHASGYEPGLENAPVDLFAKEMGVAEGWGLQPKLSISSSSVAADDTRVVILEAR